MNKVVEVVIQELEDHPQIVEEFVTALLALLARKPVLLQQTAQVVVNKIASSQEKPNA